MPRAMGLEVPVSIMVGSGRDTQLGVLFRRGDALQKLAKARVLASAKTGTLTRDRTRLPGSGPTASTGRRPCA